MNRHLLLPPVAVLAAALVSPGARAQYAAAPTVAPLSDADALAAQMRIIAAQPADVDALAQAGELSTRLGDLSGAASLFARAEKVDPRNGRVKAGMAEVLLRSERPGEALRFFDQAEGYGYPAARFAAERGLAYDLVGQQGRAQRDYRTVLAAGETAEVRRRYALSLGIAGQGEAALQELDPLIRRNDRGAWRSRAFILAMGGDVAGATAIATTMMAPGQAQGLAPFFARLASLGPVDRAFAVHFGELRPTPQRLADARLAPALSPLAPEIVQVARAAPAAAVAARPVDRRHRRKGEVQLAAAIPVPAPVARPPTYGTAAGALPPAAPVAVTAVPRSATAATPVAGTRAPVPPAAGAPATYYVPGSLLPRYSPRAVAVPLARDRAEPAPRVAEGIVTPAAAAGTSVASSPVPTRVSPAAPAAVVAAVPPPVAVHPAPAAGFASAATGLPVPGSPASTLPPASGSPAAYPAATVASASPPPATPMPSALPAAMPAASGGGPAPAPVASVVPVAPSAGSDAVLARIAEALAVPGRELAAAGAAAPVASRETMPAPATAPAAEAAGGALVVNGQLTEAGRLATARRRRAAERVPVAATTPPAEPPATDRASSRAARHELAATDTAEPAPPRSRRQRAADKAAADRTSADRPAADDAPGDVPAPVDRKAAARQAAADRKARAEKKAAAEQKALADREAAEERKARKAEPERYWVQVAGGANEGDLPKAWSAMKAKAPALAAHKGYTTPLRATNRVVTGPFKTEEEARAFVNTLKKQGVSAFQFTSEAGQKVSRLDARSADK